MSGRWLVGVVGAAALVLAACGDSDTSGGGDDGGGQTDGPAAQADGPATQADGPAAQADGPATQADGPAAQDDGASSQDDAATCIPAATPGPSGMNAGQACLGCHANMSGARHFTLGGTLYTDAAGSGRVGGATVRVTDANGQVLDLVTGSDGNFWTGQTLAFPVSLMASKCPDTATMPSTPSSGDCNQSGCHSAGNRIHLP